MTLKLTKKPKNATIIEGFPGFGLVATIVTGYLIDNLEFEQIGTCYFEDVQPTVAIHGCEKMEPVSVLYNKKHNLVLIHAIAPPQHIEWKAADMVIDVAKQIQAKEVITVEGVGTKDYQNRAFFYVEEAKTRKKFRDIGIDCLGEGIIVGVTAALMQKLPKKTTCLFAEAHSQLPDSKAAAKIVEVLDDYLGLKIETEPLLEQAEKFESKLKGLVEQAEKTKEEKRKKQLSYLG